MEWTDKCRARASTFLIRSAIALLRHAEQTLNSIHDKALFEQTAAEIDKMISDLYAELTEELLDIEGGRQ